MKYSTKDQAIIDHALKIMESPLRGEGFTHSDAVKDYLCTQFAGKECEHFAVMFLDARHRLIEFEFMFRGTIDEASVYPREVAKRALEVNAAAVIFSHNHPSGNTRPSQSDEHITNRLVDCLALFDIRVLDHIIVSGNDSTSFSEKGLV